MAEAEREVLERRRKHLIIRVDRADLSKNVLRGFTAFDVFLTQHPEFREEVTFIAHLQPSRQDVPEYAEYLERIEALVAVVNHRHGTTDWMPIDLQIYENFHDAVARYKHFDLLMVNSIFDGMNLVAKEAPAVNTRNGVLMLSENTGSHEELGDCVLSVNPFDIQEQADAIHRALTMDPEERRLRSERLKEIIYSRNPGDWVDDQLHDIEEMRAQLAGGRGGRSTPSSLNFFAGRLGWPSVLVVAKKYRRSEGVDLLLRHVICWVGLLCSRRWGEGWGGFGAWAEVRGVRVHWRGTAKVVLVLVGGVAALQIVPSLLKAPEAPPLAPDVGLPRIEVRTGAEPAPVTRKRPKPLQRHPRPPHHRPKPKPAPPAATAAPPPAPEPPPPAPAPSPAPAPPPAPEPPPPPEDGSAEFAPH